MNSFTMWHTDKKEYFAIKKMKHSLMLWHGWTLKTCSVKEIKHKAHSFRYFFFFQIAHEILIPTFSFSTCYVGSWFPDQQLNWCPLDWKRGIVTTGPSGMSLWYLLFEISRIGKSLQTESRLMVTLCCRGRAWVGHNWRIQGFFCRWWKYSNIYCSDNHTTPWIYQKQLNCIL